MLPAETATLWAALWLLYLVNHLRVVPIEWAGIAIAPLARHQRRVAKVILPRTPFKVGKNRQLVMLTPLRPDLVVVNSRWSPVAGSGTAVSLSGSSALCWLVVVQLVALPLLLVLPPLLSLISLAGAMVGFILTHLLLTVLVAWLSQRALQGSYAVTCRWCALLEVACNFAAMPLVATILLGRQSLVAERLEVALRHGKPKMRAAFLVALKERLADMLENDEISDDEVHRYWRRLGGRP